MNSALPLCSTRHGLLSKSCLIKFTTISRKMSGGQANKVSSSDHTFKLHISPSHKCHIWATELVISLSIIVGKQFFVIRRAVVTIALVLANVQKKTNCVVDIFSWFNRITSRKYLCNGKFSIYVSVSIGIDSRGDTRTRSKILTDK